MNENLRELIFKLADELSSLSVDADIEQDKTSDPEKIAELVGMSFAYRDAYYRIRWAFRNKETEDGN